METPASENGGKKQIAVFLLDDHEVVRRGVRDMLEAEGDIKVIGEAGTASSALARIPALRPDVAVLDVRLPDGDGVSVCREFRSRKPEVAGTWIQRWEAARPAARARNARPRKR